jgi:hypothetical protein
MLHMTPLASRALFLNVIYIFEMAWSYRYVFCVLTRNPQHETRNLSFCYKNDRLLSIPAYFMCSDPIEPHRNGSGLDIMLT